MIKKYKPLRPTTTLRLLLPKFIRSGNKLSPLKGMPEAQADSPPAASTVIWSIDIDREGPRRFTAVRTDRAGQTIASGPYRSIQEAIRAQASAAVGLADFIEFRFDGMSSGTHLAEGVAGRASAIAERLTALVSENQRLQADRDPGSALMDVVASSDGAVPTNLVVPSQFGDGVFFTSEDKHG